MSDSHNRNGQRPGGPDPTLRTDRPAPWVFVLVGTRDYHFLILQNIQFIRSISPGAEIWVYDLGGPGPATLFPQGIHYIDWAPPAPDEDYVLGDYSPDHALFVAKALNSRSSSWKRRIGKYFLKRFPEFWVSRTLISRAINYDRQLIRKALALRDFSKRIGRRSFLFLDADAFPIKPFDEIFEGSPDVILLLVPEAERGWSHNRCHMISAGLMGFGANPEIRDAFFAEWIEAIGKTYEIMREQTALSRLLRAKENVRFHEWTDQFVPFLNQSANLRLIPFYQYNQPLTRRDLQVGGYERYRNAQVIHLAGVVQDRRAYDRLLDIVKRWASLGKA